MLSQCFNDYCCSLGQNIPDYIYEAVLSFSCLGVVLFLVLRPNRRGWECLSKFLLIEYLFILYCSNVIFRDYNPNLAHDFTPFWSYMKIYNGDYTFQLPEKVMNLVAFIPVGLLLGSAFQRIKWWQVFSTGFLVSLSIEILQFTLKRGFAEFDDVFHNTLGCLIGYMLVKGSLFMVHGLKRVKHENG